MSPSLGLSLCGSIAQKSQTRRDRMFDLRSAFPRMTILFFVHRNNARRNTPASLQYSPRSARFSKLHYFSLSKLLFRHSSESRQVVCIIKDLPLTTAELQLGNSRVLFDSQRLRHGPCQDTL